MDVSEIRDRIVDVQVMRLGEVEDHPLNYKIHTDLQGAAMDGVVEEVGWAGIPLAYHSERNGGKLTYLDGHLRKRRFPNLQARVAITDLNDAEADLFLLTYDPIAAMAHEIADQVQSLTTCPDVAVLCRGEHLCMSMRGIKSPAVMSTSVMRGQFRESAEARAEFLQILDGSRYGNS